MRNKKIVSTTHFYDCIAGEYDKYLSNPSDETVRREVSVFFRSTVRGKSVMDFGGGTGLDLPWLMDSKYKVYFCEPSTNMRRKAEEFAHSFDEGLRPIFLQSSDFTIWQKDNLPVEEKLSGVLANFGVLNYVDNLPLLFEKLHELLDENGSVVANLLYASPSKLLLKYFRSTVKAFIHGGKIKTGSQYNGMRHETILYSIRDIESAAREYFVLRSYKKLGIKSDFLLVHLMKK